MAVQHLNGSAIEADAGAPFAAAAVAQCIAEHFSSYNEEFGRITRRAGGHFRSGDWQAAHHDAVARIELYEERVRQCVERLREAVPCGAEHLALWVQIKNAYEQQIQRRPDGDFYRTFFNSVTRDLHATVGVNPEVEFCATSMGRASGMVPINVYPVGAALPGALREILADQPFADAIVELESAVRTLSTQVGRYLDSGRDSARPETIEMIAPPFYRGHEAFIVGRMIGDGAITPLILALRRTPEGVRVEPALLTRSEVSSLFGFARSYFHVDLPVVSAAVTLLRSFLPHKPVDELYTVLGRAKQGKTERYFALCRHLDASIDSFVHAPGERGLVMIVFTLPSHDLVFKVIRDRFGAPKNSSRAEVMASYRFVFHHDRAGRLVDAQEFRRLRLPRSRFMPALVDELLHEAGESCRIEGEDLIIEHCYMERRLRPLNLFLRDADPAAAEAAVIDYGQALRDLAASDVFPGDLLLKNFGVTRGGRVIFYDYDELCLVSDCKFRALPAPATEEEALSAEPWFYVGEHDVFPEQWLQFLSMSEPLREVFVRHHGELLTPAWWRTMQQATAAAPNVRTALQLACA